MNRSKRTIPALFLIGLLGACLFASWGWLRPYEWQHDSSTGFKIRHAQLKRDRNNYWLDLHLNGLEDHRHDFLQPILLQTASGRIIAPADTRFDGTFDTRIRSMWLKFWLEKNDLEGALQLRLNGGMLKVRQHVGVPELSDSESRVFSTCNW